MGMVKFKKRWLLIPLLLLLSFYLWGMWRFMTRADHIDHYHIDHYMIRNDVKFTVSQYEEGLVIKPFDLTENTIVYAGKLTKSTPSTVLIKWLFKPNSQKEVVSINCEFNKENKKCMSVNDDAIYITDLSWFSPNTLYTIEMKTKNIENDTNNDHFDSYMHFCKIHDEIFFGYDGSAFPAECYTEFNKP